MVEFRSVSPYGNSVILGTASLDPTGTAVFSMDQLYPAGHAIYAVYPGDVDDMGSTSGTITQLVQPADTTITVISANPVIVSGQANTFSLSLAVVPPGAPIIPATGTVTFYERLTLPLRTGISGGRGSGRAFGHRGSAGASPSRENENER
jgi:hypothetical protein